MPQTVPTQVQAHRAPAAAGVPPSRAATHAAATTASDEEREEDELHVQVRFELFRIVSNCFEFQLARRARAAGGGGGGGAGGEGGCSSGRCGDGVHSDAKVANRNVRDFAWRIAHAALHNARRCVSTQLKPVLACTRKPRKFGIFPLFKDYSLLNRPKPYLTIRNYFHRCRRRERPGRGPRRRAVGWAAGELLQWLG